MAFLERYLSILPGAQVAEIRRQIEKRARSGEIRTQEQFNRELASAITEITTDNKPLTKTPAVRVLERTNAELYNDFCSSVLVDLRALYQECNYTDYLIGLEESNSKDFTDNANVAIRSIRGSLISRRENYREIGSYPNVFFESFDNPGNRYLRGVEFQNGVLRLGRREVQNHVFEIEKVEILRYPRSGVLYVIDSEFNPETRPNVLSPGTFRGYWAETALADAIPKMEFENDSEIPNNQTYSGILAIARITFTAPISLNSLGIDPYTEFPLEIPWLRYKTTRSGSWKHITKSGGSRFTVETTNQTFIDNLDRIVVSVIEIPLLQKNSSTISALLPINEEQQLEFFQNAIANDTRELEYEIDKYLTTKTENVSYRKAVARILRSDGVENSVREVFDVLGIGKKALQKSSTGIIGLDADCPSCITEVTNLESSLKHSFVYGLFGISPLSVLYNRRGLYKSPEFDNVEKQIVSAVLEAEYETPDITSVNFSLEMEGERRLPILPTGVTLFREHIPVGKDRNYFPKAYYTEDVSQDEFIPNRRSSSVAQMNRVFPSFYIKSPYNSSNLKMYRNGVQVPFSAFLIDEKDRHISLYVSGDNPLYAPFALEDDILLEYYVDPEYEAPRHIRYTSVSLTTSGDATINLQSNAEFNPGRGYALHASIPSTQWYYFNEDEYYFNGNQIVISGNVLGSIFPSFEGMNIDFAFFSFNPLVKGNVGRRDFTGSPYRIDVISSLTQRQGTTERFFISSKKFVGKYRLDNYVIELEHIPLIDYNLYNYDSTWANDPDTGLPYIPISVVIGGGTSSIRAVDVTPYKSEEIPYLIPYEELGFYQFYLRGNALFFNTQSIPLDITISYEHTGASMRLVAELHTNRPGVSDYTPLVKDYTLRLGTLL